MTEKIVVDREVKFTETHEWVYLEEGIATIGVSNYAQEELGDIVYVELPEVGKTVAAGEEAVVLESTKAAADVYSPISGEIVAVNERLQDSPEEINRSPEESGWLFRVRLQEQSAFDSLLSKEQYQDLIK